MLKELDMKKYGGWLITIAVMLSKFDRYYDLPEWVEVVGGLIIMFIVARVVWNGFQNWREERRAMR